MAVGDPIAAFKTAVTLEASGASISAGSVVQADDANLDISAQSYWPDGEFYLICAFPTAPTEGRAINLLARLLDIDGSGNHAEVPEATRPGYWLGAFVVNNVTSTQRIPLNGGVVRDLPLKAAIYLHNATDQTMSSGWKLVCVPRNTIPATS